ncbi:MAG TPA: aspartyl protease family protein [Pyrinomonadaceae bacterium]|jgi:predicted aspartyl protease/Tfp pilus assembly protein PilF|nr:aspartyl protease family protein [Pyrinomonadaceae bacterium]
MLNRLSVKRARLGLAAGCLAAIAVLIAVAVTPDTAFAADKARDRAVRALREGEFDVAEKLFRELLAKNAQDKDARLGLSFTLFKKRMLQDAYDHAARVIASDPLSARAHALLGSVVLAAGDFRLSVEEFRTALSLKDDEALAIAGLAMVDFYENRASVAVTGLKRAVFIDPNEPDYIFNLAQASARTERYKEAADAYERFLVIAPKTDADRRARIRGLIDFLRYLGQQNSLYIIGGENRTEISFEVPDNRPMVLVYINGEKQPLRFVLDTGSGMSVISQETARRLGLREVARGGTARAIGGGGRFDIVYGFLQSLEIGDVRVENVPVYIRRFFNDKTHVDGYIGLSVISKYLTTVDYGSRRLTLLRRSSSSSASAPAAATPGIELPLRTTSAGFLSGEVLIESVDKPLNFIIDTGATVSVVSQILAEREDLTRFAQNVRLQIYGSAGVADNVKLLTLPRITFGSYTREKLSAAVLDMDSINETAGFEQTGIVGGNFLRHFRLIFDFQKGILRLEPLGTSPEANPTRFDVGVGGL